MAEPNFYTFAEQGKADDDSGRKLVTIFNIKEKQGGGLELGDMRAVIADNGQINTGELVSKGTPQELAVNLMSTDNKGKLKMDGGVITGEKIRGAAPAVQVVADPAASVEFDTTTMANDTVIEFTAKQDFGYASDAAIAAAQRAAPEGEAFNPADVNKDIDFPINSIGQIKKTAAGFEIHQKPLEIVPGSLRTCATAVELASILNNNVTINNDPEPNNFDKFRTFTGGRRARSKSAKRKSKRGGRRRKRKSAKRKH